MPAHVGRYKYFSRITILVAVHPKTDPGAISLTPWVRANCALMGLGRF